MTWRQKSAVIPEHLHIGGIKCHSNATRMSYSVWYCYSSGNNLYDRIDNKRNGRESFAAQQICVVSIFGINSMWVKYIFIVVSWSMNASMMCCLCCAKINN